MENTVVTGVNNSYIYIRCRNWCKY